MDNHNYKDQITQHKAKLAIVIGLAVVVLVTEIAMAWNWYSRNKGRGGIEERLILKKPEFEKLWVRLKGKTVPVELETEIRYGEDIGKLEPFN